jgi:AraC-like DNA-binding protein
VTPGILFRLENEVPNYGQIIRLGFHGGRIEKLFTAADLDKKQSVCSNLSSKDILKSIDLILNSRNDGVIGAAVRAREILNVIILFMDTLHEKEGSQNRTDNIYIQSAINFINNHYSENIDVQSIADYLGISRTYFTVLFQKMIKITPSRYLMNVRMEAAERYLTSTDTLVSDVAEKCGFSNAYSFSTSFRKRYGLSPVQYRKEQKEDHE